MAPSSRRYVANAPQLCRFGCNLIGRLKICSETHPIGLVSTTVLPEEVLMLTGSLIDSRVRRQLTGTRHALYALLGVFIACSCSSSSTTVGDAKDDDGDELEPSLYERYASYFPIGAAVDSSSYQDAHVPLLKKHFNSIVCENEMKWEALQPTEGTFNYTTADQMVAFAEANRMKVRGHTLVWHNQTPAWVFVDTANAPVSKDVLLQRMRDHITNVMTHFR